MYIRESYFMMNSNPEQFHNYIDVVERTLSREYIFEQSFQSFRESLENISKLYLEHTTDSNDFQSLQNIMKILTEYFQKGKNGVYKADTQRAESSRSAVNWLKNSYNIKCLTKNTEDVSVSKDRVGTTGLPEPVTDQNSTSVSSPNKREEQIFTPAEDKDGPNKREIQTLTSAEDKDGTKVLRKGDPGNLNEADDKNIDKLSKTNEIKSGNNEHIRTEPEHVTSKMHPHLNITEDLLYIRKMEKEIEELKTEIESKNQMIVTQTENVKELSKAVNTQSEMHTAAACHKEELIKKNLEIENLSKEITDTQRKNFAEIKLLQYKLNLLQQELQKQKDENNSLQSKLILKGDQLKKLELDIEIQKNIAVCENRQHQEKSKELQEFKTKSAELQNNLKTKSDELISKLRELSECKSDLVRYADNNASLCNQLALLHKDHDDLGSKLKINSTNYQKETTSLKGQLFSEKKATAELSTQFESLKDYLKKLRDSYNELDSDYNNLKNKFDETLAELNEMNATNLKLERENVDIGNKNSELNQKLEGVNFQLQEANKKLLSLQEEHKKVSNELDQVQKSLEKTTTNLNDSQNKYREEYRKNVHSKNVMKRFLGMQNETENELVMFIEQHFRSQTLKDIIASERENIKENALSQLDSIKSEVDGHRKEVHTFTGNKKSKTFLHLQELIQRSVGKIDQIQSQDIPEIKHKKRELIKYCETVDKELQSKVTFA